MEIKKVRLLEKKNDLNFQNRPLFKFISHLHDQADDCLKGQWIDLERKSELFARRKVITDLMEAIRG